MDINCVSDCMYQNDGKCGLTELRAGGRLYMGANGGHDDACPYFAHKNAGRRPDARQTW